MDFWKDLTENKELKEELYNCLKNSGAESETKKIDAIAKFAKEKGYEVLEEDLEIAKAKLTKGELSDDELANIVGGASPDEMQRWCAGDYLCTTAWNNCRVSNECEDGLWTCTSAMSQGSCNRGMSDTKGCTGIFWSFSMDHCSAERQI